jgi:hypothetical protein
MKRETFARCFVVPAVAIGLFLALLDMASLTPGAKFYAWAAGLPITRNETLRIYSSGARGGHYLNGNPADTFAAVPETTYAFPTWGMQQGVLLVTDSSIVGSIYVDSMQVAYSLSWDGVNGGTNWTQPRTVLSASYAQNKPSIPDTFMVAVRGRIDTTISITASATTDGGRVPVYFFPHTDSTTVQSYGRAMMPWARIIFTPKARVRGGGTGNAPLIGLKAEFHQVVDVENPFKTGGP